MESFVLLRQSIVAWVNRILGTYCKAAVHKKGDKFLPGRWHSTAQHSKDWLRFYLSDWKVGSGFYEYFLANYGTLIIWYFQLIFKKSTLLSLEKR